MLWRQKRSLETGSSITFTRLWLTATRRNTQCIHFRLKRHHHARYVIKLPTSKELLLIALKWNSMERMMPLRSDCSSREMDPNMYTYVDHDATTCELNGSRNLVHENRKYPVVFFILQQPGPAIKVLPRKHQVGKAITLYLKTTHILTHTCISP